MATLTRRSMALAGTLLIAVLLSRGPAAGAEVPNPSSLMDELSFYVNFDKSADADVYRAAPFAMFGQSQKKPVLVPGRWGNALPAGIWPSYYQSYNFNAIEGSAAFWTKPEFDPAVPAPHIRMALMLAYSCLTLSIEKGKTDLEFYHRGTRNRAFPDDVRYDISKWKKGEWHHVAMTWSDKSGEKKLYIDGALVSEAKGQRFNSWSKPVNFATHRPNFIGNHYHTVYGQDWGGQFDELGFWQRPLASEEVRQLAAADPKSWLKKTERSWPWESLEVRLGYPMVDGDKSACFVEGEPVRVEVPVTNASDKARTERFRFLLTDYYGKEAGSLEKTVSLEPGKLTRIPVEMKTADRGYFRMTAQWLGADGKPLDSLDVAGLLVVAANITPTKDEEDSLLGAQLHDLGDERNLDMAAKIGLRWTRAALATEWKHVAVLDPDKPNVWDTPQIERNLRAMARLRALHILILGWFANGTISENHYQSEAQIAKNPDRWFKLFEEYVRKDVTTFGPYIRHWQFWCEASSGSWRSTLDRHLETAELCKRIVKELQPDGVFICPGGMNGLAGGYPASWGEQVRQGLVKGVSWASFHAGASEESIEKSTENYRKMLEGNGSGPMRLMIDEGYAPQGTTAYRDLRSREMPLPEYAIAPDPRSAVNGLMKDFIACQVLNVRPFIYYMINHPSKSQMAREPDLSCFSEPYVALEFNGFPRPIVMAFATVAHRFDGAKFVKRFDVNSAVVYLFERGGKPLAVAWANDRRGAFELGIPSDQLVLYNVMDNTVRVQGGPLKIALREEPVFIQGEGIAMEAMSTALAAATFKPSARTATGTAIQEYDATLDAQ